MSFTFPISFKLRLMLFVHLVRRRLVQPKPFLASPPLYGVSRGILPIFQRSKKCEKDHLRKECSSSKDDFTFLETSWWCWSKYRRRRWYFLKMAAISALVLIHLFHCVCFVEAGNLFQHSQDWGHWKRGQRSLLRYASLAIQILSAREVWGRRFHILGQCQVGL